MYVQISLPHIQRDVNLIEEQPFESELDFTQLKNGREYLTQLEERLVDLFKQGYAIKRLLQYRTHYMDLLLQKLYHHFGLSKEHDLTLLAVGGYGRGELFLKSDIDLLLASKAPLSEQVQEQISSFISYLWDLKLDVGSSVRTIAETLENVNADLTIGTNLRETLFVCGNYALYNELLDTTKRASTRNTKRFFHAKVAE